MPTLTRRRLSAGAWRAWRGGAGAPILAGRDALIAGVHKPTPETTGAYLKPGESYTEVGSGAQMTLSPGTYRNRVFLGAVNFTVGSGAYLFERCIFAGNDPGNSTDENFTGSSGGSVVKNSGSSEPKQAVTMVDCTIDPGYWMTVKGRDRIWPELNGIFGGNFTVRRCIIKNTCDGVGINAHNYGFTLELSILHTGTYATGPENTGQSDQRTHNDGIQFHTGKNIVIRGNVIGYDETEPDEAKRSRHMAGYQVAFDDGYNSGHDYENSCFMIKQESGTAANQTIENVVIEQNWIYGGLCGINFFYEPSRPNRFGSTVVRNNRFGRRQAGWGVTRRMSGELTSSNGGNGWYFLKSAQIDATITGNVFEDTGLPIPISG